MSVSFPFRKDKATFLGPVRRPVAEVYLKHTQLNIWRKTTMLVDTGADYTLLPKYLAILLGINIEKDCNMISGKGIGGESKVYFVKNKVPVRIGKFNRKIPLGFLNHDYIPPILGRHEFFETFKVVFEKFQTRFEES